MMLEEAYRGPRPRVRFDGVTAIVSVADRALNLQGGSAGTLELEKSRRSADRPTPKWG
jgi:hypothetical protein